MAMETNAAQIDGKTQASRLGSIDGLWGALPLVLSFGAEKIFGTENQVFTMFLPWLGPLGPLGPMFLRSCPPCPPCPSNFRDLLFVVHPVLGGCSVTPVSVVVMGSTLRSWTKTRSTGNLAVKAQSHIKLTESENQSICHGKQWQEPTITILENWVEIHDNKMGFYDDSA
jgi:hypothetical protein